MMMKIPAYVLVLLAGCWLMLHSPGIAQADTVYTWVDSRGVTHFSETPPPDPDIQAAMIELTPLPPAPPSAQDDYYSVIRQAERMERRRLENEKLEAERLQAEAEALRARMEAEAAMAQTDGYADEDTRYNYVPAYPYYPYHRPGYGNKPWHPGHWPAQPKHRPPRWTGQPGPAPGRPGFGPRAHRVISAIPAKR
jgi:hypothetical protein